MALNELNKQYKSLKSHWSVLRSQHSSLIMMFQKVKNLGNDLKKNPLETSFQIVQEGYHEGSQGESRIPLITTSLNNILMLALLQSTYFCWFIATVSVRGL